MNYKTTFILSLVSVGTLGAGWGEESNDNSFLVYEKLKQEFYSIKDCVHASPYRIRRKELFDHAAQKVLASEYGSFFKYDVDNSDLSEQSKNFWLSRFTGVQDIAKWNDKRDLLFQFAFFMEPDFVLLCDYRFDNDFLSVERFKKSELDPQLLRKLVVGAEDEWELLLVPSPMYDSSEE